MYLDVSNILVQGLQNRVATWKNYINFIKNEYKIKILFFDLLRLTISIL